MDFALDSSGELTQTGGHIDEVDGIAEVGQRIKIALETLRGQWFLDESFGVPWFDSVFGKVRSDRVLQAVLRQVVLDVPGVVRITSFSLSLDNETRELDVEWQVEVDDSDETLRGSVTIEGVA